MKIQIFILCCMTAFMVNCQSNQKEKMAEVAPVETKDTIPVHVPKFDYDTTKWLDLADLDPTIVMDLRYATANNFVEEKMYECGRCFMRPKAARKLVEAHKMLQEQGYALKMYDCYRPRPVQQKLWDKVPNPNYVARPWKGSEHNKGVAVDLTIVDKDGKELDMGTPYDFFGKEAHQTYTKFDNPDVVKNRQLLRRTLRKYGFSHIRTEWWHYSYKGKVVSRAISDMLWNCEN